MYNNIKKQFIFHLSFLSPKRNNCSLKKTKTSGAHHHHKNFNKNLFSQNIGKSEEILVNLRSLSNSSLSKISNHNALKSDFLLPNKKMKKFQLNQSVSLNNNNLRHKISYISSESFTKNKNLTPMLMPIKNYLGYDRYHKRININSSNSNIKFEQFNINFNNFAFQPFQ